MTTSTFLYSHNKHTPAVLPHRIRFSDGTTRTDSSTFSPEELERAGYSGPYEIPEYDSKVETVEWDGESFLVRPYNEVELEQKWSKIREQRNQLLKASDWAMIKDYDFDVDQSPWIVYRQSLRDITLLPNPFDLTWPNMPTIDS